MSVFHDLIFDYTLRNIALGSMLLGIVSGILGSYAVLRRQGLLGDTLSHAALPGIVLAFILTGSRASIVLLIGAGIAGWIGTLILLRTVKNTKLSEDTALGVILSVFYGIGILLLTWVQGQNNANQAGLDRYLFGQAASIIESDVITFFVLGTLALLVVVLLYKEFKLLSFDPEFAFSLGYPVKWLDILLTSLLVIAVMIGLQTVGVVLMAAMVIGPGTAARQWTDRLHVMLILAGGFGAAAGVTGAILSVQASRLPTGPMIILALTVIVLFSIFFAPNRGIVPDAIRRRRQRESIRQSGQPAGLPEVNA